MTQNEMVLRHLRLRGSITPLEALSKYGIMRLAARIEELRRKGLQIETEKKGKQGFAEYSIKK